MKKILFLSIPINILVLSILFSYCVTPGKEIQKAIEENQSEEMILNLLKKYIEPKNSRSKREIREINDKFPSLLNFIEKKSYQRAIRYIAENFDHFYQLAYYSTIGEFLDILKRQYSRDIPSGKPLLLSILKNHPDLIQDLMKFDSTRSNIQSIIFLSFQKAIQNQDYEVFRQFLQMGYANIPDSTIKETIFKDKNVSNRLIPFLKNFPKKGKKEKEFSKELLVKIFYTIPKNLNPDNEKEKAKIMYTNYVKSKQHKKLLLKIFKTPSIPLPDPDHTDFVQSLIWYNDKDILNSYLKRFPDWKHKIKTHQDWIQLTSQWQLWNSFEFLLENHVPFPDKREKLTQELMQILENFWPNAIWYDPYLDIEEFYGYKEPDTNHKLLLYNFYLNNIKTTTKILLEKYKINPNSFPGKIGYSPMHILFYKFATYSQLDDYYTTLFEILDLFIKHGGSLNIRDKIDGYTPLILLTVKVNMQFSGSRLPRIIIQCLKKYNANTSIQDHYGYNLLDHFLERKTYVDIHFDYNTCKTYEYLGVVKDCEIQNDYLKALGLIRSRMH